MLTKAYSKDKSTCKVTFEIDPEFAQQHEIKTVHIAGDFNGWDWQGNKMTKRKAGGFYTTVKLDAGKSYQFRYVLNESLWINDGAADGYRPNDTGEENSVVNV